jgi:hypothetical protein
MLAAWRGRVMARYSHHRARHWAGHWQGTRDCLLNPGAAALPRNTSVEDVMSVRDGPSSRVWRGGASTSPEVWAAVRFLGPRGMSPDVAGVATGR